MIDLHALHPIEFPGLVRMGNATGDGGYVMPPDLVRDATVLLSLGLGTDWTFDEEVRRMNPRVRIIGVDHSIRSSYFLRLFVRSGIKRFIYGVVRDREKREKYDRSLDLARRYFTLFANPNEHVRRMVGSTDGAGHVTIDTLVRRYCADADRCVLLKMDIEGSEYEVIPSVVAHADRFSVFTAEFHGIAGDPDRFNAAIALLSSAFSVVHIHGNNCGIWSNAINFPDTVEITFVNRGLLDGPVVSTTCAYPRPGLDVPNDPQREDYVLSFPARAGD
jgi:hypothetical protein